MQQPIPAEFLGTRVAILDHAGRRWLTARDIGLCLGYAQDRAADAINNLYHRHADEFGPDDTFTIKLMGNPQGGNPNTRVFSQTGCILLAMFANTPRAKDFRAWAKQALAAPSAPPPAPWLQRLPAPQVTRAVERQVLECYAAGGSLTEVGAAFGLDRSTISRLVNGKYRFAIGAGPDETTPALREAVARRILARDLESMARRRIISHNTGLQQSIDAQARALLAGPVRALLPNAEG